MGLRDGRPTNSWFDSHQSHLPLYVDSSAVIAMYAGALSSSILLPGRSKALPVTGRGGT
jgi:hypothetical protein